MFDHLFRVLMHGLDKGAHVLRVHVRVKAVAQIGDVAPCAKTLQHLLHGIRNAVLKKRRTESGRRRKGEEQITKKDENKFLVFVL